MYMKERGRERVEGVTERDTVGVREIAGVKEKRETKIAGRGAGERDILWAEGERYRGVREKFGVKEIVRGGEREWESKRAIDVRE